MWGGFSCHYLMFPQSVQALSDLLLDKATSEAMLLCRAFFCYFINATFGSFLLISRHILFERCKI